MKDKKYLLYAFLLIILSIKISYSNNLNKHVESIVADYMSKGDYKTAEEVGLQFISDHPMNCFAYSLVYNIYKKSGDISKAEKILKQGISSNPNCFKLYLHLAENSFSLNRYKESLYYLEELGENFKQVDIDSFELYKFKGKVFFFLNDYENAITYLKKCLKFKWTDYDIYSMLITSYFNIHNQEYANTFKELQNLIYKKKNISQKDYNIYYGILLIKYKKYQDAITVLGQSYFDMRKNIRINFNIGLAYFLSGDYTEALPYIKEAVYLYDKKYKVRRFLERLLRIESEGAKYRLLLSVTYYKNIEESEAKRWYNTIKDYDTNIYKSYPYDTFKDNEAKIYKDIPYFYEFP